MVVGDVATGTEVAIIGGGPGGYAAALRAAQLGKDVVLISDAELGGVCLHAGCIPSKALITAAGTYHRLEGLAAWGIDIAAATIDIPRLQAWKQGVVQRLTGGIQQLCRANDVQVVRGRARFTAAHRLVVATANGHQNFSFEQAIIATGSRPRELPNFTFDGSHILDAGAALNVTRVPPRLLIIGGGYIGVELGSMFANLGSQVTIVEMADQLLPGTDPELVQVLAASLRKRGLQILLQARAETWRPDGDALLATVHRQGPAGVETAAIPCDQILVSVGRRPNSEDLGLDLAGVTTTGEGFIAVDEQGRTAADHIFAVGDVTGEPLLAHKASGQGIAAAEALAGQAAAFEPTAIPAVIFTDPELAYVGLTASAARQLGFAVTVGRFPFQASGRALITGSAAGFVQVVADVASGLVLGIQMIGDDVSTLISEAALALEMGTRLEDLALTVHPHPTLGEALMEAAYAALGRPLHTILPSTRSGATPRSEPRAGAAAAVKGLPLGGADAGG